MLDDVRTTLNAVNFVKFEQQLLATLQALPTPAGRIGIGPTVTTLEGLASTLVPNSHTVLSNNHLILTHDVHNPLTWRGFYYPQEDQVRQSVTLTGGLLPTFTTSHIELDEWAHPWALLGKVSPQTLSQYKEHVMEVFVEAFSPTARFCFNQLYNLVETTKRLQTLRFSPAPTYQPVLDNVTMHARNISVLSKTSDVSLPLLVGLSTTFKGDTEQFIKTLHAL